MYQTAWLECTFDRIKETVERFLEHHQESDIRSMSVARDEETGRCGILVLYRYAPVIKPRPE